ncbi:MAG TPA: redoxin domain-containing protein, partial [Gammaproteobacteria bacterium]|nr:redoxin domain-containing protein [Gammaproteobacteria bacterium]
MLIRRFLFPGLVAVFCLLLTPGALWAADSAKADYPPAIAFPEGLPWLNVERPLTLKDLRGKVVILDFWTYGCINCIHVLEDLRKLEQKFGNRIAVIGVHTPKFENEKNSKTLRRILLRYDIQHPVINDVDKVLATAYGMRAWPTQYLINPAGDVLGKVEGEGNGELFVNVITDLLKEHADIIDEKPLPLALEKASTGLLAAPGKIATSDRYVAISDTLHHRIILADHQGKIQKIIGGTEPGMVDGASAKARFSSPQGLVFSEQGLYVADTGNHRIRFIRLKTGEVSTVAGNGNNEVHRSGVFAATSIGLRSPWALALRDRQLYIAMAGIHQIWKLDLDHAQISPWAGSGRESIDDGDLSVASFSQPSGLSLFDDALYVADAEDSAVRQIRFSTKKVTTLVGTGLFDFGDQDGAFKQARLQHVLGVAALNHKKIYIADTYNHKLKLLDLERRQVKTVVGNGQPGE